MTLLLILVFSLLGNVATVLLAAVVLLPGSRWRDHVVQDLVSYATGALLGAAFLGMLPRCLTMVPAAPALAAVLAGLIGFYVLESGLVLRHCHKPGCEHHTASGPLILVGDGVHNFADGVMIAAAFVESVPFGIAMALAVIAHEIPQELGDFGILLEHGYTKLRALAYNTISGAAAVVGGLIGYFFLTAVRGGLPYVLAISASSFIYIALADLIPAHRGRTGFRGWLIHTLLILLGVATTAVLGHLE
jgi:zinc and cadmium transporter